MTNYLGSSTAPPDGRRRRRRSAETPTKGTGRFVIDISYRTRGRPSFVPFFFFPEKILILPLEFCERELPPRPFTAAGRRRVR
ncbi:hypothetical protein EVAR_54474_1 [Eumeta japonica]|uniref:Uncharacterized protein n=1 Tax=Eumeta variegata TaxID=151549 RepID=A0A4C1YWC2_EUMVA|nr:hypothetical protein EVAR_54474_1 [Eumeta japonica]